MGLAGAAAEDAESEYIRKICECEVVTGMSFINDKMRVTGDPSLMLSELIYTFAFNPPNLEITQKMLKS